MDVRLKQGKSYEHTQSKAIDDSRGTVSGISDIRVLSPVAGCILCVSTSRVDTGSEAIVTTTLVIEQKGAGVKVKGDVE